MPYDGPRRRRPRNMTPEQLRAETARYREQWLAAGFRGDRSDWTERDWRQAYLNMMREEMEVVATEAAIIDAQEGTPRPRRRRRRRSSSVRVVGGGFIADMHRLIASGAITEEQANEIALAPHGVDIALGHGYSIDDVETLTREQLAQVARLSGSLRSFGSPLAPFDCDPTPRTLSEDESRRAAAMRDRAGRFMQNELSRSGRVESNEMVDGYPAELAIPAAPRREPLNNNTARSQAARARFDASIPSGAPGNEYPLSVAESIDDDMKFRRATRNALRSYARAKPWRGTVEERLEKMRAVARQLAAAYDKPVPTITVDATLSHNGWYSPGTHTIALSPNLSVITFLHEFAHHLGKNERGACRWSTNLFKRYFPRSFARLSHDGHMLRRRDEE